MNDRARVLVMGGTRGTGELIALRLLEEGYPVRLFARTPEKAHRKFGDRVEVAGGDVTEPDTIPPALAGVEHVVYTIGIPRRIAGRGAVRATVRDGTLAALEAASRAGLPGRLMYMSALGTTRWSPLGALLNLVKGNTLKLRREVEREIRASPLTHTIIHAGILRDAPARRRPVELSQRELALRPRYRIARAAVAEVFVRALATPRAADTTFDAVWARGTAPGSLDEQLARLEPD